MRQLLNPPATFFHVEQAVAVRVDRALPDPAVARTLDLRLESLSHITRVWSRHNANHTTKYTEFIGRQLLAYLTVSFSTC